jgi:hypothetical protein
MQGKNIAVGIITIIAVALGGYLIFKTGLPEGSFNIPTRQEQSDRLEYSSNELGISFSYPAKYFLEERTINTAERLHKTIVLIEDTPTNRELIKGEVPSEGPTAITIDVFQNNLDKNTAKQFIEGNAFSNYKLGNGEIEEGTLGNLPAYRYFWDGLYRGESVVVANDNHIYMFSATYLEETDDIRSDLYEILDTVKIK